MSPLHSRHSLAKLQGTQPAGHFFTYLTNDKVPLNRFNLTRSTIQRISLPRFGLQLGVVLLGLLAFTQVLAQNTQPQKTKSDASLPTMTPPPEAALVNSVSVLNEQSAPAIEVISTHQVVPSIEFLDSPPRLVIDLLNARMGLQRKRVPVLQENILTIRTEQYQETPPIVRIVVDLLVPYKYTWDIAGNRLMVRLKPLNAPNQAANAAGNKSPFQPPQALSLAPSAGPTGEPKIVPLAGGAGEVSVSDKRLAPGSSLTAGPDTAVLHLSRGGEIRVCPGTTVSVTPSNNSHDLMLGMSTGSVEMHYALDASADSVLTPDFRILFAGPGEFDYAISADSHGNTCVRGLAGNSSSVIVSELMGDRTYQVKPAGQAVFRNGRIDRVDADVPPDCGCPLPVPVMRAAAAESEAPATASVTGAVTSSQPEAPPQTLSSGPETRPVPPSQPGDIQVQIDAPMVFRGKKNSSAPPAPVIPAPVIDVAQLPVMESSARPMWLELQAQPPAPSAAPASQHHSLLHKIKGFFAAIFR